MKSKRSMSKLVFSAVFVLLSISYLFAPVPVFAQGNISICTFIAPLCNAVGISDEEGNLVDGASAAAGSFIGDRLNLLLSLIFVGIIILAVFIIIQAGVKYIQSQGDEGKIEESTKAIKSVFIGIAILFVGIVGVVLVLAFFGGTGLLEGGGEETCGLDDAGNFTCEEPVTTLDGEDI